MDDIPNVVLVDDDEKEEDISDDENYTRDGEEAYEEDDSNFESVVFVILFQCVTKHFNHQEPLFCFLYLYLVFVFISFASSRLYY